MIKKQKRKLNDPLKSRRINHKVSRNFLTKHGVFNDSISAFKTRFHTNSINVSIIDVKQNNIDNNVIVVMLPFTATNTN